MSAFIPLILGSTRRNRQSLKVATYVHRLLSQYPAIETSIVDLEVLDLPIMEERLRFRDDPPPGLLDFSRLIARADSILIVTPEYNNGYPGVLKNALDYLLPEYERKPFGICTVSAGGFGGINCLAQLRLVTLALGGFPIPESLAVSKVQDSFDELGNPKSPAFEKRARDFLDELIWFTDAIRAKKAGEPQTSAA